MDGIYSSSARDTSSTSRAACRPVFHLTPAPPPPCPCVRWRPEQSQQPTRSGALASASDGSSDTPQRQWGEGRRRSQVSGQAHAPRARGPVPVALLYCTGPPRLDHATLWLRNRTHVVCARRPPGKIQRATGVGCSLADADRCPARARKGTGKHLRISGAATSRSIRYHERVISREDAGLAPLHRYLQCNKQWMVLVGGGGRRNGICAGESETRDCGPMLERTSTRLGQIRV